MRIYPRVVPDIAGMLAILHRHQVHYVILGSVGAVAYGAALVPGDLDICPAPDPENLCRLAETLLELAAKPRHIPGWNTPAECEGWSPSPLTVEQFDHRFTTALGDLDILPAPRGPQGAIDRFTFARLDEHAIPLQIFGIIVRVVDLEDLIDSKMSLQRRKDFAAYPELQRLRRRSLEE